MPEPFTCVLPHSAPPLVRARAHDANHSLGRLSLGVTCQPTTHCSQAPVIITFRMPTDASFSFDAFYERLAAAGYIIYPGKLTAAPSFRVGCIGHLFEDDMHAFVDAARTALVAMGVMSGAAGMLTGR